MGYVGNQTTNSYTSMDKQTITGNGGTSYTLDHAVANVNEIEVFVNNVRQEPSVAYTVAGTALTMTGNVASSDDFYVVFQGKALQTVVPPDGSVTSAKLASGAAASNLGTSVNLATIKDSTGTNTAMTVASNGVVKQNQLPFFHAHDVTNSTAASGYKTIDWANRDVTDKINWDATNYRITPTVAGYYQISFNYGHLNGNHDGTTIRISHSVYGQVGICNADRSHSLNVSVVTYFDGVDDYITTDVYHNNTGHADDNTDRKNNVTVYLVRAD